MHFKSYFAGTVASAVSLARGELGPDAMIVQSRRSPPEARHLGDYEVVVAMDACGTGVSACHNTSAPEPSPQAGPNAAGALAAELAEVRRQLERMALSIARSNLFKAGLEPASPELAGVLSGLLCAELDPELAHDAIGRLRAAGVAPAGLDEALRAELGKRFHVDTSLGRPDGTPKVVAVVGPSGAGKTTTLVKLAVRYGVAARKATTLLSMDNFRVGAAEQLRSFASILGVGFQALESPAALAVALEENRRKDLLLVDTPGHGARDLDYSEDLARFLATHPAIDTHLVLTASMKSADLSRAVDRFEVFRPRKLLFTRIDETNSFGPLVNEAARTGKPVSFLCGGQAVPEDLEPAAKDRILDLLLNGGAARGK